MDRKPLQVNTKDEIVLTPKLVRQFTKQLSREQISDFESIGVIEENICNIISKNVTRVLNTDKEKSIWTCINMDTVKLLEKNMPVIVEVYKKGNTHAGYTGSGTITSTKLNLNTSNMFFNTKQKISSIISPTKKNKRNASPLSKFSKSVHTFYKVNLRQVINISNQDCKSVPFEFCNRNELGNIHYNKKTSKRMFNINPVQETITQFGNFILCSIYDTEYNKDNDHFAMVFIKCQQPNN